MSLKFALLCGTCLLVPSMLLSASATAQSSPSPAQGSSSQLEEIVVTAQRRTENLQNVPVSVVALGGEQLQRQGVHTVEGLNRLAPNAIVERVGLFPGAAALSMRGIGYTGIESFTDPDVAVYVNGIYQARNATALSQALDIQSIEVLRGPQGTLYGRNAYAGAISVKTNRPQMTDFSGSAAATIGNYGLRDFDLVANVPISKDLFAARLAMRSHNLDGLYRNNGILRGTVDPNLAGDRVGAEKSLVVRPSLRFTPSDRWDIQLIGEFLREKDQAAPINTIPQTPNLASASGFTPSLVVGFGGYQHNPFGDKRLGIPSDGTGKYTTGYTPSLGPMKFNQDSVTLDASYDLDFGSLRFLGNHQTTKSEVWVDTDGSVANIFSSARYEHYRADSAELQFISSWDAPIDLTAGAFAFQDSYRTTQLTYQNPSTLQPDIFSLSNYLRLAPGGTTATCNGSLPTAARTGCLYPAFTIGYTNNAGKRKAYAAYIQGEYHITQRLSAVAGVRYSYERKYDYFGSSTELGTTGLGTNFNPARNLPSMTPGQNFRAAPLKNHNFAPRLGLNYKVSDDVFLFGFWQKAFKSGGFNANSSDRSAFETPYGPEKVSNFEGGVKSEFFDRRLRLNIQGFYAKYTDLQRSQIVPSPTSPLGVVNTVTNNADVKSYGVELEMAARPAEGLTIFTNLGWLKAKYDRYCFDFTGPEATPTPRADTTRAVCGPTTTIPLANGTVQYLTPQDYSANRPTRAPRWDITAGFTKDVELSFGRVSLTGSMNYRSNLDVDLANRPFTYRPAMTTFDANIVFVPTNGRYSVNVWDRNLTNKVEILGYTPVATLFAIGAPTAPRTYGVTVQANF